jgi:hypothetical protein
MQAGGKLKDQEEEDNDGEYIFPTLDPERIQSRHEI